MTADITAAWDAIEHQRQFRTLVYKGNLDFRRANALAAIRRLLNPIGVQSTPRYPIYRMLSETVDIRDGYVWWPSEVERTLKAALESGLITEREDPLLTNNCWGLRFHDAVESMRDEADKFSRYTERQITNRGG